MKDEKRFQANRGFFPPLAAPHDMVRLSFRSIDCYRKGKNESCKAITQVEQTIFYEPDNSGAMFIVQYPVS